MSRSKEEKRSRNKAQRRRRELEFRLRKKGKAKPMVAQRDRQMCLVFDEETIRKASGHDVVLATYHQQIKNRILEIMGRR
jgi:hypothetical protein